MISGLEHYDVELMTWLTRLAPPGWRLRGTLSIFYDLSRRFTLRAQTGEKSAVDLIFTIRYD